MKPTLADRAGPSAAEPLSGGLFPDREEELLLTAALGEREDAARAWSEWRAGVDLDDLGGAGLKALPLAFRNLSAHGLLAGDPDAGRIRGVYRRSWVSNQLLLSLAERTIDAFGAAGIETMALKGVALNAAYYPDRGARPMADVDLLVRPADLTRAAELLGSLGFTDPGADLERARVRQHALPFGAGTGEALDLHWHSLMLSTGDEDFWAAAVEVPLGDAMALTLCPSDQLLHALVHGLTDLKSFLWVADAVAIARTHEIDWDRLLDTAERRRLTAVVSAALGYLSDRGRLDVPEAALERIDDTRVSRWERAGVAALAMPQGPLRTMRLARDRRRRMRETLPPEQVPGPWAALDGIGPYRARGRLLIDGPRAIGRSLLRRLPDRRSARRRSGVLKQ